MAVFTVLMVSPDIDTGIALTKGLRFRSLCDAVLNAFRSHVGEGSDFDELSAIVNRAEQLEPQRNKLVHSPIHVIETDIEIAYLWKVTAKRKGIKRLHEQISPPELELLSQELVELERKLMGFLSRLALANRLKYVKPG